MIEEVIKDIINSISIIINRFNIILIVDNSYYWEVNENKNEDWNEDWNENWNEDWNEDWNEEDSSEIFDWLLDLSLIVQFNALFLCLLSK